MVKEREGGGMGWNQTSWVPLGGPEMSLSLECLPWSQVQPAYSLKLVKLSRKRNRTRLQVKGALALIFREQDRWVGTRKSVLQREQEPGASHRSRGGPSESSRSQESRML